ncbi:hypothetical protein CVS40_6569 [Lucilia cuprina]|nr:hypothetical protein CVS40_6569 [Lucilia cuprina]
MLTPFQLMNFIHQGVFVGGQFFKKYPLMAKCIFTEGLDFTGVIYVALLNECDVYFVMAECIA